MPVLQGGDGGGFKFGSFKFGGLSFKVVHLGRIGVKGDAWEGAGGRWERASKG